MSIQRDPDGRRSVRVEVEVEGTPEQVWQAIATGPGISAWFVPTTMDGKLGGSTTQDFGGGMTSTARITAYEPPFRFAAESPGWAPGMPPLATEWTVAAHGGGSCTVRVVHSLFASTDDWDNQLEGTEHGWPIYFGVLRRYLERFAGQPCAQVQALAMTDGPVAAVWTKLAGALRLAQASPRQRVSVQIAPGVSIAGTIDRVAEVGDHCSALLHLDEPGPGTMTVGAFGCGGTMASLQLYLYGALAGSIAREATPLLQHWLGELFPPPAAPAN